MALETKILGKIIPSSTTDTYPTHDEKYGKGGYRSVSSIEARDAIPEDRLSIGMEVRVMDGDNKTYYLKSLNPNVWEENKTFNREDDLGIGESDVLITDKNFSSQFNDLLSSVDYATSFKTQFEKLYKNEVHLGTYVNETSFTDISGVELSPVKENLYIDKNTRVIYTCENGITLKENSNTSTWNDIKGGLPVKFATGPEDEYVQDDYTVYFAQNADGSIKNILFNGLDYTGVQTDSVVDTSTSGSTNPVETLAVYRALNKIRTDFSEGIITGITNTYESGTLVTTLTTQGGTTISSVPTVLKSDEVAKEPYISLGQVNSAVYTGSKEDPVNLKFNFNFYQPGANKIPVAESDYTSTLILSYRSASGGSSKTINTDGFNLKTGLNTLNVLDYLTAADDISEGVTYYFDLTIEVQYKGTTYTVDEYQRPTYSYMIVWLDLTVTNIDGNNDLITTSISSESDTAYIGYVLDGTNAAVSNAEVRVYLDGNLEPNSVNKQGGDSIAIDFSKASKVAGEHIVQVVAVYQSEGGTTIYSNLEYFKIFVGTPVAPVINVYIPIDGGSENPLVLVNPIIEVTQFCQYQINYYILYPEDATEKEPVVFKSKSGAVTTLCGEYSVTEGICSTFTYRYLDTGQRICTIECGDSLFTYNVNVVNSGLNINNPIANLKIYLDGSGKSNNAESKDQWSYGKVTTDFSGFSWGENDGWQTDDSGETYLRLVNGAALNINYKPLDSANFELSNSLTFTTKFKVSNVADVNEAIISFLDSDGKGFLVTPQVVSFASTGQTTISKEDALDDEDSGAGAIKAVINQDEVHTIGLVIYPSTTSDALKQHEGVVYLYIDGIISGMSKINANATTLVQAVDPQSIKIQATNCQLDLYSIRCYSSYTSSDNMLNMYLIDSGDYQLMLDRYEFNNVFDKGVPIPGANGLPYLIINGTSTNDNGKTGASVLMLANKDKDKFGIESIQFVDPNNLSRNFYCVTLCDTSKNYTERSTSNSPALQIQGTSSSVYPVKNLKIKLKGGLTYLGLPYDAMRHQYVEYKYDDSKKDYSKSKLKVGGVTYDNLKKYQISPNSTKEGTFTIKVDYAESSGSHNAGVANFVNSLLTGVKEYIPPQKMQANYDTTKTASDPENAKASSHKADIRTTCEGRAIMLYYRTSEDSELIFGGKANILNDKSNESVFGFTGIENYTESFVDNSADFYEIDDFIPLRVITNPDLAGTVNTIYQESFQDRNAVVTTDSEGNEITKYVLTGNTPFESWNAFVTFINGLSEANKKKWIDLIMSEATFTIKDSDDKLIQFAFVSDIDNKLLMIEEKAATTKPLIADSSFQVTDIEGISGLAVKDTNTLYAVSDKQNSDQNGLHTIDLQTKTATLIKGLEKDCEAVSVDSTGKIVIAVEGNVDPTTKVSDADTQCIYTFASETADPVAVTNDDFASFLEDDNVKDGKGRGFEAVCHYNDDIIFIGNQAKPKDIVVYNLTTSTILATVELKKVDGLYEEIADFEYDRTAKKLYVLDSNLGYITVWNVDATTWAFTRDTSIEYKVPAAAVYDAINNPDANPEGLAIIGDKFYISDENGSTIFVCSIGEVESGYNLTAAKHNPIQCWEFRTNDNDMGFFLNTDFRTTMTDGVTPLWFNNVWESRFPDDTDSNNAEYAGGRIPYSLYTLAQWIKSTDRNIVGLTEQQKLERANKFLTELPLYFNVNMLCDYYMITEVIAAADQRVKNMMWAFYYDPELDTDADVMHGLRVYPIFYDNDTILGVNNSGILFDKFSGELTLPWDCDHSTTCATSGYGGRYQAGHPLANNNTQYAFSGHDMVVWVNLRELMQDQLKQAYLRLNDASSTTGLMLNYSSLINVFDNLFTGKYAESVFNADAVYKYVSPKQNTHYAKAQGSRRAHRHWFLLNRTQMFDAKFGLYSGRYMEVKGGDAAGKAEMILTMDHDWWCGMYNTDQHSWAQFAAKKGEPTTISFNEAFKSNPTNGSSASLYGLERAQKLEINWDSTQQITFQPTQAQYQLPLLTEYVQSSFVKASVGMPDLNNCPNLKHITLNNLKVPDGFAVMLKPLIKLLSLDINNCTGACTAIELPEGGLIEHLHLPGSSGTSLKFVNLPLLTNEGIEFDETGSWSNVTSLIVKDCPNLNSENLLKLVYESVNNVYLTGLNLEGDGQDLISMMNRGVKGYKESLNAVDVNTCTLYGTYKLTVLLDEATYTSLCAYFPGLEIKNLEYSLYKFATGANETSVVTVTNMETGKTGNDADYAPTGHAAAILAKRQGYLVKPKDGDSSTGEFVATMLSPTNHNVFLDNSAANLTGANGDYMIYEPEYWYKGVNDFRNNAVYAAYSSTKPSNPAYSTLTVNDFSSVASSDLFNSTNAYVVNTAVNAAKGTNVLTTFSDSGYTTFYYVIPLNSKTKKFRVVGTVFTMNRGAVVIDKDKNILQRLSATKASGMYNGSYLIGDLSECEGTPYAIVFTVPASSASSDKLLVLTNSSDMMDLEDWVKHCETFVGRSYSVPGEGGDGDVVSRVYGETNGQYWSTAFTKSVVLVNQLVKARGASYTTFDYEQFKDTINLAFIKYGTTDLDSISGTGLSTGLSGGTTYYKEYSLANLGMSDTKTYDGGGASYYDDPNNDRAVETFNPLIMGYEKLTGCGSSCSTNDVIKNGSTLNLYNSRTDRTIPLYYQSNPITASIIYPIEGKYLDLFNNGTADYTSTKVGYCGTIYTSNSTNQSYTKGYLSIGRMNNQGTTGNNQHMIYMSAAASQSVPELQVNVSSRTSLSNAVRLMIIPEHVDFVESNNY